MSYTKVRHFLDMLMYLNFDMRMLEKLLKMPEPSQGDIKAYAVEGAEY